MRTKLAAAAALAAAILAPAVAHPSDAMARAEEAYENFRWPGAVVSLESAAQSGDRSAQRLLGFMLLYGERLYPGVKSDRAKAFYWLRQAANQGDEGAAFVVQRADRRVAGGTSQ